MPHKLMDESGRYAGLADLTTAPATRWTVDVRRITSDEAWATMEEKPSADACKTWARKHRRFTGGGYAYRIYDPGGRLAFFSYPGAGWRIEWHWGPLTPREDR